MKRILVAGATGYLGSYVAQEFRRQGHFVRALAGKTRTPRPLAGRDSESGFQASVDLLIKIPCSPPLYRYDAAMRLNKMYKNDKNRCPFIVVNIEDIQNVKIKTFVVGFISSPVSKGERKRNAG